MNVRIGVDTGGTFTDVIIYDESSERYHVTKVTSTPPDLETGVLTGVEKILNDTGFQAADVSFFSHGTTIGTNAILEGRLPDMGLITNEGLRDVIEIGDQTRPEEEIFNFFVEKPPTLVPRYLRKGVSGRIDSNGDVLEDLDEPEVADVVEELVSEGVESIVVSMLFSYLNEDHERRVGDIIERVDPSVDFALSSEVFPEIREYDRTVTTVLNQGLKTTIRDYLTNLDGGIRELGMDVPLNVMHSGGGIFSRAEAVNNAVRTFASGPAAGAVAVERLSDKVGKSNVIGMDVGGTSADVSVVHDGELVRTTEGEINHLPLKTTMIDINTVGAGGGSIAWIDEGGALRVGPESAGADPGPICYDRGGDDPTVTDANLLLGRINDETFLGGEMELAVEKTRRLFEETIAAPLNQSAPEAALNTIKIANASLARNIRKVTLERGEDPREFSLVAFGGAGPLHAADVAREMDIGTVIVPRDPGVLSAEGLLVAPIQLDESRSYRGDRPDGELLKEQFEELEQELSARMQNQGLTADEATIEYKTDIRYVGQSYELTIPVPKTSEKIIDDINDKFNSKHERIYGYARTDEPFEIVILRANARIPTVALEREVETAETDAYRGTRDVYFESSGFVSTDIYERPIPPTTTIRGPAVLEENVSTTVVPPESTATVSKQGYITISL